MPCFTSGCHYCLVRSLEKRAAICSFFADKDCGFCAAVLLCFVWLGVQYCAAYVRGLLIDLHVMCEMSRDAVYWASKVWGGTYS